MTLTFAGLPLDSKLFYEGFEMAFSKRDKKKREVRSRFDWMSNLPLHLHDVPLFKLAIPGSHDSMSYDLDVNSSIIEPDKLKKFSKICCVRKIMRRWAVTQDKTITEQLDAGVRYFDLRVARKPKDTNPTRLFFYHGLYTKTDVETVLRVINDWATSHPKEILILELSNFKEMTETLHQHLINFIKTLFGGKLFPKNEIPTLNRCWNKGKNVIIAYDYPKASQSGLWKKITYCYGKSMDPRTIVSQLQQALETPRPSHCFFICGLNLTLPDDMRILKYILRLCDNFANVIQRSLPRLLQWVKIQALSLIHI